MLKIRMQRRGRTNIPSYRIVVTEHTAAPQAGKFVELVGSYNPKSKERNLKEDRIKYWMSVGAKPSDTVHNMLVSAGILNDEKINVLPSYKAPAKEELAVAPDATPATMAAPDEESTAEAEDTMGALKDTPSKVVVQEG